MERSHFRIVRDEPDFPETLKHGVVAIGNFDGVHLGHRGVLDRALALAQALDAPAVAMTFEPHPRTYFKPEQPVFRLTPPAEKAELIEAMGYAGLVETRFDNLFARMPASSFVYRVLGQRMRVRHVVAGHDFHFGYRRFGTPAFLVERCREMGVGVTLIDPVTDGSGKVVSSTRIRGALAHGDMKLAASLLGRSWSVCGTVEAGKQIGRTLGYPTANVSLAPEVELAFGIYAVRVRRADGSVHGGVASYGRRPTFDNGAALLESYLFDFSGDLYGERICVELVEWLRGEERFDSVEALVRQMDADAARARAIMAGMAG